jgi:hypothetical protein
LAREFGEEGQREAENIKSLVKNSGVRQVEVQ